MSVEHQSHPVELNFSGAGVAESAAVMREASVNTYDPTSVLLLSKALRQRH